MPFQRERYPQNWADISRHIRARENNQCKWCGVPNGAIGYRTARGEFVKVFDSIADADLRADALAADGIKLVRIVLTVAHLGVSRADGTPGDPHDKMDVRDENFAALCQRCHLRYDLREHITNAAKTRRKKIVAGGQLEFLP